MSGYVRLYRSLVNEHPAFRNDAEAMAFAWLVAKAAWQPVRVRYKERIINLKRGQLAISQRDMARALDRDKAWVERLWKRLKGEAMIAVDSEAGVAVITICKYEQYQSRGVGREALDEAPHEARARQGQGTEQVREEREEDNSGSKEPSARDLWARPPVLVEIQTWKDFKQNRTRKRLGFTISTYRKLEADLSRVSSQTGIPPPQLLALCAAEGWGGIYDPNERKQRNDHGTNRQQSSDGLSPTSRAALSVFGGG